MSNIETEVTAPTRNVVDVTVSATPVSLVDVSVDTKSVQERNVVETQFSTRPVRRSSVRKDTTEFMPEELQNLMKETDRLSTDIINNDAISDPSVDVVSSQSNTTITSPTQEIEEEQILSTPEEHKDKVVVEEEDDDSIDIFNSVEPVEEKKEEPIVTSTIQEEVKVEETKVKEEDTTTPKPTTNVIPTDTQKTVVKQVTAKAIQVEDDPLDIGIVSSGKEEIKPVSINIEDMFIPFDGSTEKTINTEKERTEIVVPNISDEELTKIVANITSVSMSDDTTARENLIKKNSDLTSYESRINRAILFDTPRRRIEEESFKEAIENKDEIVNSKSIDGVNYKDTKSSKSQLRRLENGSIIDSKNSLSMTMALLGGIRKIHFYNSGFWVVVRPPLISELHTYFTRCQQETVMYGRQFGQLSFLPADVEISRAGLELFKSCIDSSNLVNCKEDDVFERNLAVSDEKTYLWALASLMFPEGTEIEYVCSNKDCHYIDRVLIDLAKIRYFDYSRLGLEALKYCHSSDKRTEEDIKNYKENIFKSTKSYELDKSWTLLVQEPSLYDQLEFKTNFVEELSSTLELTQFDKIDDFVTTRYFRLLSPWVKRVSYTNDADGKKIYLSDERSSIIDVVDALQLRYVNLPEIITKHIKDIQVSYFCYSYNSCPKCGNIPTTEIEGLIPCDIQQSFFSLTVEKLK